MSTPRLSLILATGGVAALAALAVVAVPSLRGTSGQAAAQTRAVPPMEIGMNIGPLRYFSQEFPFADLVKVSSVKTRGPNGWVDASTVFETDVAGYPIKVPRGTTLFVLMKSGGGDQTPSGTYDCVISPGWAVRGSGIVSVSGSGPRFRMTVPATPGRVSLDITPAAADARLDALSCHDRTVPADQDFNPAFLANMKPFGVLRFMDWMSTNGQPPQEWARRTTPHSLTQANANGVAIEHMVALANAEDADPWFNLPLEAPDDYYREFATYVRDHLRPDRRAYVEVSNEVWNAQFAQSKRATARGLELYPASTPGEANDFYYADRVRAVMAIWSDVFRAKPSRIVRVLATQAGSKRRVVAALSHDGTAHSVDAVAIAPYFAPGGKEELPKTDLAEYLISQSPSYVDRAIEHGVASREAAAQFGLPLITYEGGPSYVTGRPSLKDAFQAASRDPRMYDIYSTFLRRWKAEVGGLYMAYNSVSSAFGHADYTGQPLSEAPKMRALIDFTRANHLKRGRAEGTPPPKATK